jgi:ATP-dependent protease HslVU (ClpYQ) ATPase subunit
MIISGKSGSGKTEILRQTAKLCKSPFIKVDAVRYTEVGFHGDDVDNIIRSLYKKTKLEFRKNFKEMFWNFKSVQSAWEHIVMTSLLGKSYEKNELYKDYAEKLHKGNLDNLDLKIFYSDKDKYETFKIGDIKAYFLKENLGKISQELDIEEIVKQDIEQRGIICIDEFDKLIRDVNKILFIIRKM